MLQGCCDSQELLSQYKSAITPPQVPHLRSSYWAAHSRRECLRYGSAPAGDGARATRQTCDRARQTQYGDDCQRTRMSDPVPYTRQYPSSTPSSTNGTPSSTNGTPAVPQLSPISQVLYSPPSQPPPHPDNIYSFLKPLFRRPTHGPTHGPQQA